jgi:hypothetical protein
LSDEKERKDSYFPNNVREAGGSMSEFFFMCFVAVSCLGCLWLAAAIVGGICMAAEQDDTWGDR